ncbi:FRG domain-containing protein [Vibrio aestuarianus]|uniref:FRG domain-containing protein n=1 Tax=Vibrio aestuarianus TaxID=28171 RepID=UPI0030B95F28
MFYSGAFAEYSSSSASWCSTRLLDWTESPFVAAYFAATSALSAGPETHFSIMCVSTVLINVVVQ